MKIFRDCESREWKVSINVSAIKRVKSLLDVDLLDIGDGKLFERLIDQPCDLVDVLYVLCKEQADQRGLTDAHFGESMGGDALDSATKALLEELVDFFPKRRRPILQKALAKLDHLESRLIAKATELLDDPKIDQQIEAALSTLGDSFTSAQRSSESTPDVLPFGSLSA